MTEQEISKIMDILKYTMDALKKDKEQLETQLPIMFAEATESLANAMSVVGKMEVDYINRLEEAYKTMQGKRKAIKEKLDELKTEIRLEVPQIYHLQDFLAIADRLGGYTELQFERVLALAQALKTKEGAE